MSTIFKQMTKQAWQWRWLAMCALICLAAHTARAQGTFNSGSTGADGAFNPTASQQVQLPESGVFNFTTVNIPAGVTITFRRNSRNTPVTILASGNVTILGTIDVSGGNGDANNVGIGGPGGFNGGKAGSRFVPQNGVSGDGPGGGGGAIGNDSGSGWGGGGGFASAGLNGSVFVGGNLSGIGGNAYGTKTLLPLVGGSGGGGGAGSNSGNGGVGGGGGGAILIASSGTLTFGSTARGVILANGGNSSCPVTGGGSGSGGAIRLIANAITGSANLRTSGGGVCGGSSLTSSGYIRVESFNFDGFDLSNSDTLSSGLPGLVTLPNTPTLAITSVGGVAAPASPAGSLNVTPDITLPNTQNNPVTVALRASNIPLNTTLQVRLTPPTGAPTSVQSTPLTGTVANSTATASLTLPAGQSLIYATASIDLTINTAQLKPMFIEGERVRKIEVAASFGGASEVVYVTESGRRVKLE